MEIENSDQVMVFLDSTINVIKVAGYKEAVDNLSKKVKEIIKNVCDEVDRLKHTATETLKIFKPWQIRLLLEVAHEQEMKKHFPNLNIIIDEQNCSIAFEGKSVDVQAAKDKTYAVVNNKFSLKRIEGISRAFTDLFQTGPVRNEIQKRLAKQNLVALWETDAASLVIYSYEKTLSICAEIIFESLEQRNIQVQKEMQTALSSKKWQTLNKDIREKYGDQCFVQHNEDGKKIVVTGICDVVNIVVENIETFLTENSVVKEELPIANKNVIRLLETHYSDRIENIAQELRDHNVQIWYGKGKVAVQGTEKGIELAKKKMYELCQQVEIKQHKICRPGLVSHLSSQKGKESIQHVEKTYKVVTAIVEEGHEETSVGGDWSKSKRNVPSKTTEKGNFKMHSRCRMLHDRMLYTGEGNMALLDVDVIFNSVDRSLSLSGGLGRVLVKEGICFSYILICIWDWNHYASARSSFCK